MKKRIPVQKSVTISDVARIAQVSKATAGRALGGYGSVSPDVKERILEAAQRLNYSANELARSMATGRSGTIGVIVGDIENPFFGLAVRGISDRAKAAGFDVLLANSAEDVADERAAVSVLLAKGVDGLIVAPALMTHQAHLQDVLARGRPLVLLDREIPGLDVDVALVDGRAAATTATQLLIDLGHRRIGYITAATVDGAAGVDLTKVGLSTVVERIAGFLETCRAAGFGNPERFIRFGAKGTTEAQAILVDLLTAAERPTALLASDSKIALEVFRAAKTLQLHVPGNISLVTFDDADWTSAIDPAVTVVAQPTYQLGCEAAEMLIGRIKDGPREPRRCILQATLTRRDSVARPPS